MEVSTLMLSRLTASICAIAAGVLLIVPQTAARADGAGDATQNATAAVAVEAIQDVDGALIDAAANISTDEFGDVAIDTSIRGVRIGVPTDAGAGISLEGDAGLINLGLPYADDASAAEAAQPGIVVYDNGNGSATVPVVREDGSIQVNTVIASPEAPTRYAYELDLPEGTTIETAGGTLLFVNKGKLVAGLAPAWAQDAAGRDVPTRYEIDGTTVTQVVDHNGRYAYPVVADPWLGFNLFGSIKVSSYQSKPKVDLDLSAWGWAVYSGAAQGGGLVGVAAGQAILNSSGWSEAWGKGGTVRSALDKPSQRQQFECHALGALFAGQWNLEKFRPNRTVHWSYGVGVHHCNWTTATRY